MATYYVGKDGSGTLGSDGAAGTSFALRWATMSHALGVTMAAGDTLVVCASETHQLSVQDVATSVSYATAGIELVGGNPAASGAIDGTIAYLDAGGVGTNVLFLDTAFHGYRFRNLWFRRAVGAAVQFNTGVNGCRFRNCFFDANGAEGVLTHAGSNTLLDQCTFTGNARGAYITGIATGCRFIGNTGAGLQLRGNRQSAAHGCVSHANGGAGIAVEVITSVLQPVHLSQCTIDGNTAGGVLLTPGVQYSSNLTVERCLITNHASGYGISAASACGVGLIRNHYYNNSTDRQNVTALETEDPTTGDPLYSALLSDDFQPRPGSPVLRRTNKVIVDYAGALLPHVEPVRRKSRKW